MFELYKFSDDYCKHFQNKRPSAADHMDLYLKQMEKLGKVKQS